MKKKCSTMVKYLKIFEKTVTKKYYRSIKKVFATIENNFLPSA